jgi:hypothetical protein
MGVSPLEIGRELDAIAPGSSSGVHGSFQKLLTDALPPEVRVDMHGLHLGAQSSTTLEVTEHDQFAHSHDLTVQLGHENIAPAIRLNLGQGDQVGAQFGGVFLSIVQCTVGQQFDEALHITGSSAPDDNRFHQGSMPVT